MLRLSGPAALAIARAAQVPLDGAWRVASGRWALAGGACPCRTVFAPAGRSFTGCDLVETTLAGSRAVVDLALAALIAAGAEPAPPGVFTHQALANGRLSLDQAEAILTLGTAPTAAAAAAALDRLRGALANDLRPAREALLRLRAVVEAGLDFLDEEDVRAYDPPTLRRQLDELRATVARWLVAADSLGDEPAVCLVGPANAGKSALFARLTGEPALVSPLAGTTRDWLDGLWNVAGRSVRLIDTAGWLSASGGGMDAAAVAAGRQTVAGAGLVLACSAPDAPLPAVIDLPTARTLVLATKSDLGPPDPRAAIAVSAQTGAGLTALATLVGDRLRSVAVGEPRQQRLLAETVAILARLAAALPGDVLLAEDLRRAGDLLGDLLGATTPDDILEAIFSRFCIGK